ncbi:MAG TPA: hypothetical protein VFB57_06580 [Gaiellaceae bacterium]|nr:hypothetical protein [Gaiellaceae bacterium]
MHALRHVHGLIVPDGTLVDVHPVTEERVEAASGEIGVIAEPEWLGVELPNAEAGLRQSVHEGLYLLEAEREYDVLTYFESSAELIEEKRDLLEGQPALTARIEAAAPPFVTSMRVVLRRLRVLPWS